MRWPWSRKRANECVAPVDVAEAVQARLRAEAALRAAQDRAGEVRRVAESLRQHRRVNHFAELIGDTFRGNA